MLSQFARNSNITDNNTSNTNLYDIDNINNLYDKNDYKYDEVTTGSAYSVFNTPAVDMVVTNQGDSIARQSREYYIYESNKTKVFIFTAILNNLEDSDGFTTRIGIFDNHYDKTEDTGGNGVFFKLEDGKLCTCIRYGVIDQTDLCICRTCWSHDILDGKGPSKLRLNSFNQVLTFRIEFEGDNYERVGFYIYMNGYPILVNEFLKYQHRDIIIKCNNLPVRYEITKTKDNPNVGILSQFNSSIQIEGFYNPLYLIKHENILTKPINKFSVETAEHARFSIRLQKKYNRAVIRNLVITMYSDTDFVAPIIITIVRNPIFIGETPVWVTKPNSYIEYDISACFVDTSDSEIIDIMYMNDQHFYNIHGDYQKNIILTSNIKGISDIFTVTVRKLRNATKCFASFSWNEYY